MRALVAAPVLGVVGVVLAAGAGPAAAAGGSTSRVSVSTAGRQAHSNSLFPAVSGSGRFVVFVSDADNLVPGGDPGAPQVYVRDRRTGTTSRVSVSDSGAPGIGSNDIGPESVSADGRFVAFSSDATNLVPGDANNATDIFVRDRVKGTTTCVSRTGTGAQADLSSVDPAISANGRFVGFSSYADNLVKGDTNGKEDVFLRDRATGRTTRVDVSSAGRQAADYSETPSVSGNGRYVAFTSTAGNLVPGGTNGQGHVFVRDRMSGTTRRVDVPNGGGRSDAHSFFPSISADGTAVAFASTSTTLVPGDTNGRQDIYVRSLTSQRTSRVSVSSAGGQADADSQFPSISADGRYVAFDSAATNLVGADTNAADDIFVRDRRSGSTRRVSVASGGSQADADSSNPSISADGSVVAFASAATDLVPGDTNGRYDIFLRTLGDRP